jgi:hypothetical protein
LNEFVPWAEKVISVVRTILLLQYSSVLIKLSEPKRGQSTNLDRLDEMGELKRWRDKSESSLRARCTM